MKVYCVFNIAGDNEEWYLIRIFDSQKKADDFVANEIKSIRKISSYVPNFKIQEKILE